MHACAQIPKTAGILNAKWNYMYSSSKGIINYITSLSTVLSYMTIV